MMKVSKKTTGSMKDLQDALKAKIAELEGTDASTSVNSATGTTKEMLAAFKDKLDSMTVESATKDVVEGASVSNADDEQYEKQYIDVLMEDLDSAISNSNNVSNWNWNIDWMRRELIILIVSNNNEVNEYTIPFADLSIQLDGVEYDRKKILTTMGLNKTQHASIDDEADWDNIDVSSSTKIVANRDDNYFGEIAAFNFGTQIIDTLGVGATVSKRKDKAEEPGGLIYEANKIGIDMWELLEALEGMCADGRVSEIDDSTYKIVNAKRHPVRSLFYNEEEDKNSRWLEVNSASQVYYDADGMFGEPGNISLSEIEEYWEREHEYDPSLSYYDTFDAWWADTRRWLTPVDSCNVLGSTDDIQEESGWKELHSKQVPDSDGMFTDYTLYESTSSDNSYQYICMFGDKDLYGPDESLADWSGDSLREAEDWFNSYDGSAADEEILSDTAIYSDDEDNQLCWRVYVDGEVAGTFFNDVQANMHASDYFAAGYDADRVEVVKEDYNHEDNQSIMSTDYSDEPSSFTYVLKHGFGPGTIPRDVDVLDFKDDGTVTVVELDRALTPEELDYYDISTVK